MSGRRLNYNKWDSLQLSDDSDIEVHPNVDKKSMIRWKQRDIHEKREVRKIKIHHLIQEDLMNAALLVRLRDIIKSVQDKGESWVSAEIAKLRVGIPDFEGKEFAEGEQPSQDFMILSLLSQVVNAVRTALAKEGTAAVKSEEKRKELLLLELADHERRLVERQDEVAKEKIEEEKEQKKFITSDDLHMGFDAKTIISDKPSAVSQKPAKPSTSAASSAPKPAVKPMKKETTIETINSPSYSAAAEQTPDSSDSNSSDEEENAATLSPTAVAFSKIPPLNFQLAFHAISANPSLLAEENVDALLVEAFSNAMLQTKAGDVRARACVEKGLLLQYCAKLGRDGVALFFRRMTSADQTALNVFLTDISQTSQRIIARARVVAAERDAAKAKADASEGKEQIQLVSTNPDTVITFELPDGPPPLNLEITGPEAESLDPVLVRQFLQKRWDIFEAFPEDLKKALRTKELKNVNKVLGRMEVEVAEAIVEGLQEGGILAFEEGGVRDETGAAPAQVEAAVEGGEAGSVAEGEKVIIVD